MLALTERRRQRRQQQRTFGEDVVAHVLGDEHEGDRTVKPIARRMVEARIGDAEVFGEVTFHGISASAKAAPAKRLVNIRRCLTPWKSEARR